MNQPLRTLALLLVVWSLPSGFASLLDAADAEVVALIAFCTALGLVWATREPGRAIGTVPVLALGWLAGATSYPLWGVAIIVVGMGMGLAPIEPAPAPANPIGIAALVFAAPLYEELLYRERLLDGLRRFGVSVAARIPLSASLFALPHLEAWNVLGTALVGCALATSYELTRSAGFCIALHAGLNASGLLGADPGGSGWVAGTALAAWCLGLWLARRQVGWGPALASA